MNKIIDPKKFTTPTEFSQRIEIFAKRHDVKYHEAIVLWCEENDVEIEAVVSLVTPTLKRKMAAQAEDLFLIDKDDDSKKLKL